MVMIKYVKSQKKIVFNYKTFNYKTLSSKTFNHKTFGQFLTADKVF